MKSTLYKTLIFITLSTKLLASPNEQLCLELMKDVEKKSQVSSFKILRDYFNILISPDEIIETNIQEVQVKTSMDVDHNTTKNSELKRNIIFSLGKNPKKQKNHNEALIRENYQRLLDRLQEEDEKINKVLTSVEKKCVFNRYGRKRKVDCSRKKESVETTIHRCMRTIHEVRFDYQDFSNLVGQFNKVQKDYQQIESSKFLEKKFHQMKNELNLEWDFISYTDINDVYKALKLNQDVANVVIITHGESSNGRIFDSSGIEFGPNFFSNLAPNILSLGIYSCHSDKISNDGAYEILKHLKDSAGNHIYKFFITASPKEDFLGKAGVKPIGSFLSYLKNYDDFISTKVQDLEYADTELTHNLCQLKTDLKSTSDDDYLLRLNQNFIGTSKKDKDNVYTFPCHFIKDHNNTLFIQSLLSTKKEGKVYRDFNISLNERDIKVSSVKVYKNLSQTLRSLKIKFDVLEQSK
ncbi:MAG: hypothetical protein VX341_07915 [Bdellovibrionota bacterium]|nr:hypothetical protein [Bdellovibrionota bacterium]